MDWKYLLSLSPEELADETKDELFNTITWFNTSSEELSIKKYSALFRISQEILKYKGEQVETLIHELDELAMKQGEEDAKRSDTDTEGKSMKSKMSSSLELENLEQKYNSLRMKYKKQIDVNEKHLLEIKKLQKQNTILNQEKEHLQKELQLVLRDDSRSDISETVQEQNKELIDAIHNKNKQISDLLHDIEEVEKENLLLRERITDLRDELTSATKEMEVMSEGLKAMKDQLDENVDIAQQLRAENKSLTNDVQLALEQKQHLQNQLEEFTQEVNVRIDIWKNLLEEKEQEIAQLKQAQTTHSHSSSSAASSLADNYEESHIAALNKVLSQREQQLLEIKTQLQEATKDMEESTVIMGKLKSENEIASKKIENLLDTIDNLERQLKSAHDRCQQLQEDLISSEKDREDRQKDLEELITKIKEGGNYDAARHLTDLQQLKAHNRFLEKQVANLVKVTNKLQDSVDQYSKENELLRDKLGIPEDEIISTDAIALKHKLQKKDADKMKNKIFILEEENINLKNEIHKMNKNLASLCNQIVDMNGKPDVAYYNVESLHALHDTCKEEIKILSEENEALRKGMHEILHSVNTKRESTTRIIRSETLENLLRALDVKHVSGWYHPAMRLQAELHNEQGINAQLREQLRQIKLEFDQNKKCSHDKSDDSLSLKLKQTKDEDKKEVNILSPPSNNLKDDSVDANKDIDSEIKGDLVSERVKQQELIEKYKNEQIQMEEKREQLESKIKLLSESNEILEAKLKTLVDNESEDSRARKLTEEIEKSIILSRKYRYLEDTNTRLRDANLSFKTEILNIKSDLTNKMKDVSLKNQLLQNSLNIYESKFASMVDSTLYKQVQSKLDDVTVKYRELLHNFNNVSDANQYEIDSLKKSEELFRSEKEELKMKLADALKNLHLLVDPNESVDVSIQVLSKKLSEIEVNEITERQRANHMNSLYELVREQLQKSEERFKEFEKYNKEILRKNLILQENLKDVENKLCSYVDVEAYKSLQVRYNDVVNENSTLHQKVKDIEQKYQQLEEETKTNKFWTDLQEQELLSLKHQIVDLQADTDEKTVIARISSDIIQARMNEEMWKNKFENLNKEYESYQEQYKNTQNLLESTKNANEDKQKHLKDKLRTLEEILLKKRFQYFGCIPLISEEQFIQNLKHLHEIKREMLKAKLDLEVKKTDTMILKEQAEIELKNAKAMQDVISKDDSELKKLLRWQQEKKSVLLNEVKCKRQLEFKDMQLKHALQRIQMQDIQLVKLEEELLLSHHNFDLDLSDITDSAVEANENPPKEDLETAIVKLSKTQETQTAEIAETRPDTTEDEVTNLKIELLNAANEVSSRDQQIEQLKSKITELEMNISLFRKQIGDKQSQITFYEKHILELQNKKSEPAASVSDTVDSSHGDTDEILALKNSIKCLQETINQKDQSLLKMQSLLKQDRDKHSLAAARIQEELKMLNKTLSEERKKYIELQKINEESHPSKVAIEQYVSQVHALESHAGELHTKVKTLESQLQASREEAVRWRTLADDRLRAVDDLRAKLQEQHKAEIIVYKKESEKWRNEVNTLKMMLSKRASEFETVGSDLSRIVQEKDERISELTAAVKQAMNHSKKITEKVDSFETNKLLELESAKEQLFKENETLKKRYEHLLNRERNAREEIRELRAQIVKKPASARSDKSDRSIKEQLQKKINSLENQIEDLKAKLETQCAINEQHKLRIAEDFDKWKKQKHWQQSNDKLKNKLKEKESETEKLQQTCSGYRILIERLEREKHNLENRVKNLKSSTMTANLDQVENLKIENMKLQSEVDSLKSKLEMQQHHSGGLGAALLQEKLESQERKIAVLELSAKGTVEIRAELERLQTTVSSLQKRNICLEAENLELKMDLEKSSNEVPYLREQVNHLESYIDALKSETEKQVNEKKDSLSPHSPSSKQISELERTVFILKRVVEKLQAENKRLLSGRRSYSDRPGSSEKLKRDYYRLKEQYNESLQKISQLEKASSSSITSKTVENVAGNNNFSSLSRELEQTKDQLANKSQILEKVKVLLQRAAVKEKMLLDEIAELKNAQYQKGSDQEAVAS